MNLWTSQALSLRPGW